jgi:hypothetical protein
LLYYTLRFYFPYLSLYGTQNLRSINIFSVTDRSIYCHMTSYGPYNIWLVTDRSIYCHMTLSAMNYLLYILLISVFVLCRLYHIPQCELNSVDFHCLAKVQLFIQIIYRFIWKFIVFIYFFIKCWSTSSLSRKYFRVRNLDFVGNWKFMFESTYDKK